LLLLAKGADPNAGILGITPLEHTVELNNLELFRDLIARGADVRAKTLGGETLIALAKRLKQDEMVRLLKQAGSKP